jgi:hypothetical protein
VALAQPQTQTLTLSLNPTSKVYYLLVCRVAMGHHVRTEAHGKHATSADGGQKVFPISFRELAAVLNVGARYREIIVFHSELIYPEYVLAYQRFEGSSGPL